MNTLNSLSKKSGAKQSIQNRILSEGPTTEPDRDAMRLSP